LSVPGANQQTVESGLIAIELAPSPIADNGAVIDVIGAAALVAMQLSAVLLPREGITGAAILFETVGTLALKGDKDVVVAAGADDDTVVGSQHTALLVLTVCGEWNVFRSTIVVASGMDMSDALLQTGFNLTEMTWVTQDARQLTRHWMKLGVEEEKALILTIDGVFGVTR
jgi:hypothetical protein